MKALPCSGIWHLASSPRFEETIVFIHFYGGNNKSAYRHVKLVNSLGFNAVTFSLSFNDGLPKDRIPWDSQFNFGYLNVWIEQIEAVLNKVPGKKIIYGFSSPSGAGFLACSKRHFIDISAMVFDGGPFFNNIRSVLPRLLDSSGQMSLKMRVYSGCSGPLLFGRDYRTRVEAALSQVSPALPILSIRSWKDHLVTSASIEEYFSSNSRLNLEVLNLTSAPHLRGLKNSPEEYKPRVSSFLQEFGTRSFVQASENSI